MKCPVCEAWAEPGAKTCASCGYDVGLFDSIRDLKDEIAKCRTDLGAVLQRMHSLGLKFEQLGQAASEKLTEAIRQQSPEKPAPTESSGFTEVPEQSEAAEVREPRRAIPVNDPRTDETGTEEPDEAADRNLSRSDWIDQTIERSKRAEYEKRLARRPSQTEVNFGQKWLLIAGVVVFVLGVGFFLKYSFDRGWIGPAGRVGMAYLAGFICLAIGEWLRRSIPKFGLALIGGGIATLYFATFAAFQIYGLIEQSVAFGIMVVITAGAGAAALRNDELWLAILGLIGGFLTPVVLSTGVDNQIALMTYMTILNAGILWISIWRRWTLLNYLGFAFTWALFLGWYFEHYSSGAFYDEDGIRHFYSGSKFATTMVFMNVFFAIYALAPFLRHLLDRAKAKAIGHVISVLNSCIAFALSYAIVSDRFESETVSVVTLAYAGFFFAIAPVFHIRRREGGSVAPEAFMIAQGIVFLAITVPIYFSDHWISFFWAVLAAAMIYVGARIRNLELTVFSFLLLLAATSKFYFLDLKFTFELDLSELSYSRGFRDMLPERILTAFMVVASLGAASILVRRAKTFIDESGIIERFAGLTFLGTLLVTLTLEVAAYFHDYASKAQFASISVLWTVYAIALMILGFARNSSLLRRLSFALFALTLVKVGLLDLARVDTPFRIVSCLVLGLMLIGASYLYHRFKDRILPAEQ
ncbi:MAG: DUF2339 domain-containing protein [Planctomycetes bacterium]|nr:DUF2339 domain-containing protein [Planctomycetota bacterium]